MSTFDKREKAYESKFAHDKELEFKAIARRNKLLGLWAAEKLGLTGDDAQTYAKEVVAADFDEPGEEDVFRKVFSDLQDKGVSEHQVRREMSDLMVAAREQVAKEAGKDD